MTALNYDELSEEIAGKLQAEETVVLATCADGKVTARMMCHINDGLDILFSTSRNSEKVRQMRQNPSVALATGNLKIEATAELFGHPGGHPFFLREYHRKFPQLAELYQSSEDDLLVIARPAKLALYKFLGAPCEDVLEVEGKRAYRVGLK